MHEERDPRNKNTQKTPLIKAGFIFFTENDMKKLERLIEQEESKANNKRQLELLPKTACLCIHS